MENKKKLKKKTEEEWFGNLALAQKTPKEHNEHGCCVSKRFSVKLYFHVSRISVFKFVVTFLYWFSGELFSPFVREERAEIVTVCTVQSVRNHVISEIQWIYGRLNAV